MCVIEVKFLSIACSQHELEYSQSSYINKNLQNKNKNIYVILCLVPLKWIQCDELLRSYSFYLTHLLLIAYDLFDRMSEKKKEKRENENALWTNEKKKTIFVCNVRMWDYHRTSILAFITLFSCFVLFSLSLGLNHRQKHGFWFDGRIEWCLMKAIKT